MSKQINLRMNETSLEKLTKLATEEKRTIAAMAKILIDEAIRDRELRRSHTDPAQGKPT